MDELEFKFMLEEIYKIIVINGVNKDFYVLNKQIKVGVLLVGGCLKMVN